jgi:hypothetical protein
LSGNGDAGDRGKDFLWLWRAAADRIAQAATGKRQGAGGVAAAGVTPLDHTILSGGHPRAKAPLALGNEGAGVIEDAGDSGLAVGSRVMFTGPYGVGENGAWQDWLPASLCSPKVAAARRDILTLIVSGSVKPIVERVYPFGEAGEVAPSDRGLAVWQSRPGGVIDVTTGYLKFPHVRTRFPRRDASRRRTPC